MNNITSLRIINVDSYMATPVAGIDVTYSDFRGSSINHVPIIRIFGSTNTGKKMCLHVHGVFPYFYIPYDGTDDLNSLMYQIAATMDKTINISFGQATSNAQHIYKISLVSGIPFYGYHPKPHQFLKVYLYNPHLVRKVSNLLQNEAILGKMYQPHEAHVPYILQFMIDYNLHGMSYLMLSNLKLRYDSNENNNDFPSLPKSSFCELEGDILCENILNRLEILSGKLTANPGIAILWEDERQRRRNKGDDSQINPCLSLEENNKLPTKTHENFKRILQERLINIRTDGETGERISNITVYPAETPSDSTLSNASNIDLHSPFSETDDISLSDSTLLNDTLDVTLDAEAQNLMEIMQGMGENIEEDSILSQVNQEPEEEEDYMDLSLPMAAITTPVKLEIDGNNGDDDLWDDDDDLDKTIVPQFDGNYDQASSSDSSASYIVDDSNSSDNDSKSLIKSSKKSRSLHKKYKALPITITSSTKKKSNGSSIDDNEEKLGKKSKESRRKKKDDNSTIDDNKKVGRNSQVSTTKIIDKSSPIVDKKEEPGKKSQDLKRKKMDNDSSIDDYKEEEGRKSPDSTIEKIDNNLSIDDKEEEHERKSQDFLLTEKVKRKLEFANLNTTKTEEFILCQLTKKIKKNETIETNLAKSETPLLNKKLTLVQLHDIRNNYVPVEGCSKQISQNSLDNSDISQNEKELSSLSSSSNSIPPFQRQIKETDDENQLTPVEDYSKELSQNSLDTFNISQNENKLCSFNCSSNSIPPLQGKIEEAEDENHLVPLEGCSKQVSQNSLDYSNISQKENKLSSHTFSSNSIPPFQSKIEEINDDNRLENSETFTMLSVETFSQSHTITGVVPKKRAPSRNEIIKSLDSLKIPTVDQQKPFYSNAEDVTGAVEIGYNVLKIGSKSVMHLEDFKSYYEGIDGFRRSLLDNVKWTYKNANNIKLSYCRNRTVLVTPIKMPPTRKMLRGWVKSQKTPEKVEVKQKIYLPILSPKENGDDEDDDDNYELSLSLPSPPNTKHVSSEKTNNSCQITGATFNNTYDFKMISDNYQNARTISDHQYLTILVVELHIQTRGDFKPNPEHDSIRAIFYSILNDVPINFDKPSRTRGIFAINSVSIQSEEIKTPILASAGITNFNEVVYVENEIDLLKEFVKFVQNYDPDIIAGYEIEMLSWGYLIDRAAVLGINLPAILSRIKNDSNSKRSNDYSDQRIVGRITLDIWRLFRHEIALQSYSFENLAYHILHKRIPLYSFKDLTFWWDHKSSIYRHRTVNHYIIRVDGILQLMEQLDLIGRTSELARLFGIQFYEVLSRGTQFRVESMMLRLAKPMNFIPVSPSVPQRAKMRAPEFLPLILEPESKFYVDPVIVLDFQSLYPSMIIAYNYCFSTCVGRVEHLGKNIPFEFGATQLKVSRKRLKKLVEKDLLNFSPCGVAFVKSKVRDGILPRMLREILDTRLMVKNSMKENKDDKLLQKVLHNRQLGLKLIANVTYGYTSANFSGRMPAVEIGDSVVSKGRETLQRAIEMVGRTPNWGAKVVYGDTDSLFVLVSGKTRTEAFEIGKKIANAINNDNPKPVKLKLEKVYQPCILQTKKRYVGYMYESSEQINPIYEAKGIETVRRDGCPAVSKMLEKCLRILFETKNVSFVKQYVLRQFNKIFAGRISLQDLTFAKQYRGASGYRPGACVPALELARKWTAIDKRNEPRSGERVPYIIANGPPGLPLIRLVKSPYEFLNDASLRPNTLYYITKVIIPPINRCFSLIGADLNTWFNQMPRKQFQYLPNSVSSSSPGKKFTISQYFATMNCAACDQKTQVGLCEKCRNQPQITSVILLEKIRKWEKLFYNTRLVCESCMGISNETNCISLDCPILYSLSQSARDLQQAEYARQLLSDLHF